MESNQFNPSTENAWIPQGIPTGVFVPNNQSSVTADKSVQNTVQQPIEPVVISASVTTPVPAEEGALDKILKWLARFFAKIMGQPDPITGAPNISETAKKTENIVGKMWNVANQAVAKAGDVAAKATTVVNQATEKLQQVVPPPAAPAEPTPVVQPMPEQPK